MPELNEYRKRIDEIDEKLVKLIEDRMKVSKDIAVFKADAGIEVHDPGREMEKLASVESLTQKEYNKKAIRDIFKQILNESREYQYGFIDDMKK